LVPFEQRPWMKAAEVTDATIARLRAGAVGGGGPASPDVRSGPPTGASASARGGGVARGGAAEVGFAFGRINYANGDMVGHTGDRRAAILAVEAVDLSLGRLLEVVREVGGVALVTSDHGNSDEMYERDRTGAIAIDPATGRPRARTSHSLNPVPFILYDPLGLAAGGRALTPTPAGIGRNLAPRAGESVKTSVAEFGLQAPDGDAGLAHIAATCLELLGLSPPADYAPSLLKRG
ncbi:MAG: hypothetical protein FJY75_08635, partial [Candidatus Eisenbacteria bacterium]|nr:hypothetical protein [Candidatus Eisenbacteria bacterium]